MSRRPGEGWFRPAFVRRRRREPGSGMPVDNWMAEHGSQFRRIEPQQIHWLAQIEELRPAAFVGKRDSMFRASEQILFSAVRSFSLEDQVRRVEPGDNLGAQKAAAVRILKQLQRMVIQMVPLVV